LKKLLCVSVSPWFVAVAVVTTVHCAPAAAQSRPSTRPAPAAKRTLSIRGFGDIGGVRFTASESFTTILGSPSGMVFGGGGEVVLPQNIFIGVRASRFRDTGERVFVFNGETFDLGIETTVTVRPLELTGGYRFGGAGARVIPYAGGGIGWHRYQETSVFATDAENVDETFRGYHVVGGAEVRLTRWLAVAGEAQWTTVPDALGQDANGVSAAFEETDLGGTTFRAKVVVGSW
jgi:hypothetical protein